MTLYIGLALSLIFNILAAWYIVRLLRKFLFVSGALADFYLMVRAFQVFIKSLYSMDSYHGEPMIQELIFKVKELNIEIDLFRDTFEYMLDDDLEEELNDAEAEIDQAHTQ